MKEYSLSTIKKIQTVQLGIFKAIVEVIERHHLRYVTIGGTTIGAIRHKGFIPWDDDMDIAMPLDDYLFFRQIANQELPQHYRLQNFDTNKDYCCEFSKVCDLRTRFVEKEKKHLKDYLHCVWVDVFPLLPVPDSMDRGAFYFKKQRFYSNLFRCKFLWKVAGLSTEKRRFFGGVLRPLLHIFLLPIPKRFLYSRLVRVMTEYADIRSNKCYLPGGAIVIFNKDDLFPTKKMPFESTYVCVPRNYDKVLTQEFGNYMVPPPEDKRIGHAPFFVDVGL